MEELDYIPITDRRVRWTRAQVDRVNPRNDTPNDIPFIITIVNDNIAEPTEYLEVHFTITSNGFAFPRAIARVTILDDDNIGSEL